MKALVEGKYLYLPRTTFPPNDAYPVAALLDFPTLRTTNKPIEVEIAKYVGSLIKNHTTSAHFLTGRSWRCLPTFFIGRTIPGADRFNFYIIVEEFEYIHLNRIEGQDLPIYTKYGSADRVNSRVPKTVIQQRLLGFKVLYVIKITNLPVENIGSLILQSFNGQVIAFARADLPLRGLYVLPVNT